MVFTGSELTSLIGTFLWPLFRIGALVMAAPVFGARYVPARVRLVVAANTGGRGPCRTAAAAENAGRSGRRAPRT